MVKRHAPGMQTVWRVAGAQGASDACQTARATRRTHTRSRAGCAQCKGSHVRCDEKRPSCSRCVDLSLTCCYKPPKLPLRERKVPPQPGEQAPWVVQDASSSSDTSTPSGLSRDVSPDHSWNKRPTASTSWQLVPWESLDPFHALPISMPLKSKELLHRFFQGNDFATGRTRHCAAPVFQDSNSFRNLLLTAGIYHGWINGNLGSFQSTYLVHKIETIHMVNTWIGKTSHADAVALCAKKIATLCFTECYLGKLALAETHLHGLAMYLEAHKSILPTVEDSERELIDRYFILAYSIVINLRVPFQDAAPTKAKCPSSSRTKESENLTHRRNLYGASGFAQRQKAIQMFPFFLGSTPPRGNHQIDTRMILHYLGETTAESNSRGLGAAINKADDAVNQDLYRLGWSKLVLVAVKIHMSSLFSNPSVASSEEQLLTSSWSSICVAGGIYLSNILNAVQESLPGEVQLLRYFLDILKRDAEDGLDDLRMASEIARALWFWKVFVGAFGLLSIQPSVSGQWIQGTWRDFGRYIRSWAKITGMTQWTQARKVLEKIAWPINPSQGYIAESLWNSMVSWSPSNAGDEGFAG